jgi:hypothetical protein
MGAPRAPNAIVVDSTPSLAQRNALVADARF